MPCFEPVLTIAAAVPWPIMSGAKVWTPLITPQRLTSRMRRQRPGSPNNSPPPPVPALFISTATSPNASKTEVLEAPHVVEAADVHSEGSHEIRPRRGGADLRGRGLERLAAQVGHAHFQPKRGELGGRRQADAAGRSSDDRDTARGQCGMIGHLSSSDFGSRRRLHHARGASAIACFLGDAAVWRKLSGAPLRDRDLIQFLAQPRFNCL